MHSSSESIAMLRICVTSLIAVVFKKMYSRRKLFPSFCIDIDYQMFVDNYRKKFKWIIKRKNRKRYFCYTTCQTEICVGKRGFFITNILGNTYAASCIKHTNTHPPYTRIKFTKIQSYATHGSLDRTPLKSAVFFD